MCIIKAKSKTINAEADAMVLKTVGFAEGEKIKSMGTAEADVIQLKIKSMESGNFAAIEVAKALSSSGFKLVPDVIAGASSSGGEGSLVNMLLALVIKDSMRKNSDEDTPPSAPRKPDRR